MPGIKRTRNEQDQSAVPSPKRLKPQLRPASVQPIQETLSTSEADGSTSALEPMPMAGIKRAHDEDHFEGPPSKRLRPQPRPTAVKPIEETFNVSSRDYSASSSDTDVDLSWYTDYRKEPVTGILPQDSLQDIPIQSTEGDRKPNQLCGIDQYKKLLNTVPYKRIETEFDRALPTSKDPLALSTPDAHRDRRPDLGPQDPNIDYTTAPRSTATNRYQREVYYSTTHNPLVAKAILHIAEKNLPFIDFNSSLDHLPNVGARDKFPFWHDDVEFIDADAPYTPKQGDVQIRTVFLPKYYRDGRHALGFYTRKQPSRRLCSVLVTPCTSAELIAAHLCQGADSEGRDGLQVGAGDGEWLHADVVEEYESWKHCVDLVAREWRIRFRLATMEIQEDDRVAYERDGGRWVWDGTE